MDTSVRWHIVTRIILLNYLSFLYVSFFENLTPKRFRNGLVNSLERKRNASLHPADRIKKKVISGKGEGTERRGGGKGDCKGIIRWWCIRRETFTLVSWSWAATGVLFLSTCPWDLVVIHHPASLWIRDSREPRPRYVIIGESTHKDVRRLRLSGSIHAWINTWDNTPRCDNYGARKKW